VAKVPEGAFAIPFYYYQQHMEAHGIDKAIPEMLDASAAQTQNRNRIIREGLETMRDRIREAPIDSELLRIVSDKVAASGFDRMRFRSSTNAEDLDGFSGAGLYDSVTGILNSNDRSIERAIKKVWASAWNYEAFMERGYFGIDQDSVAMGVLVHRSFPNEVANGVAITRNIYRNDNFPAFGLNVQIGENSVVNPEPGVTADQLISYNGVNEDSSFDGAPEYITYSSLTDGEPILSDQQILELTIELRRIKEHFHLKVKDYRRNYSLEEFALDVEFKYNGDDKQLYIKQARVFR
jgi:phosphoenolpyruvate synthase/pyruvate phosphate dikinase